ncbi:LAMI_0H09978g1_1 [Lachancea mirantina]|uniref:LAMI_0H09978g1_1 n=1 Tax=Lachancea mirantina TaxID=1230905 RepID=A0A1G4KGY1_9SACH|nr:LAMI_0H09978g1_1 [Lachancea mirantina]
MTFQPVFQIRKELNFASLEDESNLTQSFVEEFQSHNADTTVVDGFSNDVILVENEKYNVKKLPANMDFLPQEKNLNALIDTESGKALVADSDELYVWTFDAGYKHPNINKISLHSEHELLQSPPEVVFTWPAAADDEIDSKVPGICVVNKVTGVVKLFEEVDTINSVSSPVFRDKAHELDLKLKSKEHVISVVNCEPAGIVIATSTGRLLLIAIRDYAGQPMLKLKAQLVKSHMTLFSTSNEFKQVVSMKPGVIVGKGERILSTITRGGHFLIWNLSAVAQSYKRLEINIYEQILESLQDLYPTAHGSLQVLDSHPLPADKQAYSVLSSIRNGDEGNLYILSTIVVDEKTNSFAIFSTYRLNTIYYPIKSAEYPRLVIPAALDSKIDKFVTIFVIFENAVVLTQVSAKLDHTYPLRRKWEDIISFRKNTKIIGYGCDSEAIYLFNKKVGILRVSATKESTAPEDFRGSFVKSHLEQAIYFSNVASTPIEFNIPMEITLDREEIECGLMACAKEILLTKSEYIPPKMSSVLHQVRLRVDLFRTLLEFTKVNFLNKVRPTILLELVEYFEILNCVSTTLSYAGSSSELASLWQETLKGNEIDEETFVVHGLEGFRQVFESYLENIASTLSATSDIDSWNTGIDFLVASVYESVLNDGEQEYRYQGLQLDPAEQQSKLAWFAEGRIAELSNDLFLGYSDVLEKTENLASHALKLLSLAKALYYISNQRIAWFKDALTRTETQEYKELLTLYRKNTTVWNEILCKANQNLECLQIADFYRDLRSIVQILNNIHDEVSAEAFIPYFNKYGYDFARELFSSYVASGNLQDLYNKFPQFHPLLVKFFDENPQYSDVAWIGTVFDKKYSKASSLLLDAVERNAKQEHQLNRCQVQASIAKLCVLAANRNVEQGVLVKIQGVLDTADGLSDLKDKLRSGASLNARYHSDEEIKTLFSCLSGRVAREFQVSMHEIIEIYTLMNQKDGFFYALKLLLLNSEMFDLESYRFLNALLWRRCLLFEGPMKLTDFRNSALYFTLSRAFNELLFKANSDLPAWDMLVDLSSTSPDYFKARYADLVQTPLALADCAADEVNQIRSLGEDLVTDLKTVIATANETAGYPYVINYETNKIENIRVN